MRIDKDLATMVLKQKQVAAKYASRSLLQRSHDPDPEVSAAGAAFSEEIAAGSRCAIARIAT